MVGGLQVGPRNLRVDPNGEEDEARYVQQHVSSVTSGKTRDGSQSVHHDIHGTSSE